MCTKKLLTVSEINRNFLPFLKYLEISDPGLLNYTTFLANIEKRLFHTFVVKTPFWFWFLLVLPFLEVKLIMLLKSFLELSSYISEIFFSI